MLTQRATFYTAWSAITIFLSAFLLFQVQPLISKIILPWFGGGPAVWTSCMLFFQVVLLVGYAYAHHLSGLSRPRLALAIHLGLLISGVALLPITPGDVWKPADGTRPTFRILSLLAFHVGLPYFSLSATGPLLQAWYHRVFPERSPYRLYALSNIGSLGALLSYPFLFEPSLSTGTQASSWSWGFGVFAAMSGILALATHRFAGQITVARSREAASPDARTDEEKSSSVRVDIPSVERENPLAWLGLPALASVMLLAITNHVTQDIAVVPFFWVIPLSLYLLSFILCFDRPLWYHRRGLAAAAVVAILVLSATYIDHSIEDILKSWFNWKVNLSKYTGDLWFEAAIYMVTLFLICMVCHGELVRLKPAPRRLTAFYLMVSAGGALGGIIVALICPQVFPTFLELNVGLVLALMLSVGVVWDSYWDAWLLLRSWKKIVAFAVCFLILFFVVGAQFPAAGPSELASARNFYGVLHVRDYRTSDPQWAIRELLHGRILHGSQFQAPDKRLVPTTYYSHESGIGVTLQRFRSDRPRRVAVVGLGTGTIAAYGVSGDQYTFYEINPLVIQLAQKYFTYLKLTDAEVRIVPGDARLSMERQEAQHYDVLALDAFTGDAIPAHLLTREAFQEYLRQLAPGGVIAVHISNRYLDLTPVVGGLAHEFDLSLRRIEFFEKKKLSQASSDWLLMTRDETFWEDPVVSEHIRVVQGTYKPIPIWTDQFSNLFEIMHYTSQDVARSCTS